MSTKRRDSRGRILRTGETQCKDGRYRYTYWENGTQNDVYSWKLEPTDRVPAGKRDCIALRVKEAEIKEQLQSPYKKTNMTVLELVERYVKQKRGVRETTKAGYKTVINILKKDKFGSKLIKDICVSDAKLWLILLQENGRGYSSIRTIRGVLRPAFQMAVDDDILIKNPFCFELATVVINDSITREAISRKQERQFLEFIKNDSHFCRYYEGIYILFKTGLRISEFCGLTFSDIDMKAKTITVGHQLQRIEKKYIIEGLKPKGPGRPDRKPRVLPMTEDVYECIRTILENRKSPKVEPMIDGKVGFLYLDKNEMPLVALHWEKYFERICNKYNRIYKIQMPKITPHVCRHTFCSNMAKSGMNPKTLQYLMGHSDIRVTLNVYTHLGFEDAKNELNKLKNIKKSKIVN